MKSLTVVSPVYNEEVVIELFYHELSGVLKSLEGSYLTNILFVADRCEDGTLDALKKIAAADRSVKALYLSSRFGHQASLLAGIDHSNTDIIIMMDSDLQHPPDVIPRLLSMHEKGNDIVFTVRTDSLETGTLKRFFSRTFYKFINVLSDVPINEMAADYRLISRRVAELFRREIRERNLFLRGLFSWVGFNSASVNFVAPKRRYGKSKYSVRRLLAFGVQGVITFSRRPLQLAVLFGFSLAGLGLLNTVLTVVLYLVEAPFPTGWATLVTLISIFSGVQLIFLGIIGEYIGAILNEVKGRPHYIVDEKVNFPDA